MALQTQTYIDVRLLIRKNLLMRIGCNSKGYRIRLIGNSRQ
jgi:hypothetical protein